MTQFIKVSVVVSAGLEEKQYVTRFFNTHYVHRLEPPTNHSPYTVIHIKHYNSGDEQFRIKETPEEILAQLK